MKWGYGFSLVALGYFGFLGSIQAAQIGNQRASEESAIRAQKGCYQVTFEFTETFSLQKDYPIHSPMHIERGLEWVTEDETQDHKIALQHVLVIPDGRGGTAGLKHWRQEWTYQPDYVFNYLGNNLWTRQNLSMTESSGKWSQKVLQVDDSPRYDCVAPWIQWGQNRYWECEAWSPLPRREFSKRNDYNVLNRRNRHQITPEGWLHEQDNVKLKVTDSGVTAIAKEKGYNTYRRVSDSRCQVAQSWWTQNRSVWNAIQSVWNEFYANSNQIHLKGSVGGKKLWETLFELADQAMTQNPVNLEEVKSKTREIIGKFQLRN